MTMSCDLVEDTTFASFTDKVEVDACSTEDLLGICSAGTSDSYFYGGDAALLEGGCAANGGEWKTSTE
jgi:hypothetical protein